MKEVLYQDVQRYPREGIVVFRRTNDLFGALSNMAPGFPLRVCNVNIRTSEALYQVCRFPNDPAVQQLIIDQRSPMTAKMKSKPFRSRCRRDWDGVRIEVMRWCLRVKLAQHWDSFGAVLEASGERDIVEHSHRDRFWGATFDQEADTFFGQNVLGRLLMALREELRRGSVDPIVDPPEIDDMRLLGERIGQVGPDVGPAEADLRLFTADEAAKG